jgi:hypothetical protein
MPTFGWVLEDSVERYIESNPGTGSVSELGGAKPPAPVPALKYCPLCVQGYLEEYSLDKHIAEEHGKQHIYLKINDRVVRDICWLSRGMEKCDLVLVEMPATNVEIEFNGKTRRCAVKPSAPSLMGQIPADAANGLIRIRAQSNHLSREFQIYLGRQPDFRPEAIDQSLAGLMDGMRRDRSADLAGFHEKWLKEQLNELERRYLAGTLEYCHGWLLEEEGKHAFARDRLEAAMNLLIPFRTTFAEDMRSALALRMNVFAGHWGCDTASPFRPAELFFCSDGNGSKSEAPVRETKILVDAFSRSILDAIRAYNQKDARGVFAILNELRSRDRNDEDKMAILMARTRRDMGDLRAAASAYETLLDHPLFGAEAQKAVRKNR